MGIAELAEAGYTDRELHDWHNLVEDCSTHIIQAETHDQMVAARDELDSVAAGFSKFVNRRG